MDKEDKLQQAAFHHQTISNLLSCPICLELLISPTRTRCGHVFCGQCIEDSLKKGGGRRAANRCPLCNADGVTKRSLEPDLVISKMVTAFKNLLRAEQVDTKGKVDFMKVRVLRTGARESIGSPQKPPVAPKRVTAKRGTRTYSKLSPHSGPLILPATDMEAEIEEAVATSGAPESYLPGMFMDLMSQPSLSQAQQSTPTICPVRLPTHRPSPGLTPLRSTHPRDSGGGARSEQMVGEDDMLPPTISQTAETDDTFDKLVKAAKNHPSRGTLSHSKKEDSPIQWPEVTLYGEKIKPPEEDASSVQQGEAVRQEKEKDAASLLQEGLEIVCGNGLPSANSGEREEICGPGSLLRKRRTFQLEAESSDLMIGHLQQDTLELVAGSGHVSAAPKSCNPQIMIRRLEEISPLAALTTRSSSRLSLTDKKEHSKDSAKVAQDKDSPSKRTRAKTPANSGSNAHSSPTVTSTMSPAKITQPGPHKVSTLTVVTSGPDDCRPVAAMAEIKSPNQRRISPTKKVSSSVSASSRIRPSSKEAAGSTGISSAIVESSQRISHLPATTISVAGANTATVQRPGDASTRSPRRSPRKGANLSATPGAADARNRAGKRPRSPAASSPAGKRTAVEIYDRRPVMALNLLGRVRSHRQPSAVGQDQFSGPRVRFVQLGLLYRPHQASSLPLLDGSLPLPTLEDLVRRRRQMTSAASCGGASTHGGGGVGGLALSEGGFKVQAWLQDLDTEAARQRMTAVNMTAENMTAVNMSPSALSSPPPTTRDISPAKEAPERVVVKSALLTSPSASSIMQAGVVTRPAVTVASAVGSSALLVEQLPAVTEADKENAALDNPEVVASPSAVMAETKSSPTRRTRANMRGTTAARTKTATRSKGIKAVSPAVERSSVVSPAVGAPAAAASAAVLTSKLAVVTSEETHEKVPARARGLLARHLSEVSVAASNSPIRAQFTVGAPPRISEADRLSGSTPSRLGKVTDKSDPTTGKRRASSPVEEVVELNADACMESLSRVDKMLADVLGVGEGVYSQERETFSQEVRRLAMADFEADEILYETERADKKRSRRKNEWDSTPEKEEEDDERLGPVKRMARTRVISSSDSEGEEKQPKKKMSLHTSLHLPKGPPSFENTFKDLNDSVEIADSQPEDVNLAQRIRRTPGVRRPLVEVTNRAGLGLSPTKQDKKTSSPGGVSPAKSRSRQSSTSEESLPDIDTQDLKKELTEGLKMVASMKESLISTSRVLASPSFTQALIDNWDDGDDDDEEEEDEQGQKAGDKDKKEEDDEELPAPLPSQTDLFQALPEGLSQGVSNLSPLPPTPLIKPNHEEASCSSAEEVMGPTPVQEDTSRTRTRRSSSRAAAATSALVPTQHLKQEEDRGQAEEERGDKAALQETLMLVPESEDLEERSSQQQKEVTVKEEPTLNSQPLLDPGSWLLAASNLPPAGKTNLQKFLTTFHTKGLSNSMSDEVTHLIVGTGEDLHALRTLKYLEAVADGKLIVSHLWLDRCLAQAAIIDPRQFEVKDADLEGAEGPKRSRLAHQTGQPGILRGWEVTVLGSIESMETGSIAQLVTRAGGRFLFGLDEGRASSRLGLVGLVDTLEEIPFKEVLRSLNQLQLAVVEKEWLLDSLGSWELRPLLPYMPEGISSAQLARAGYQ